MQLLFYSSQWKEDNGLHDYIPVVCTGRQPKSDVFVVGPTLHFSSDGTEIAADDQQYIWVPEIFQKLHSDKISAPIDTIPTMSHPLNSLLKSMERISGDNLISTIYMLSEFNIMSSIQWPVY